MDLRTFNSGRRLRGERAGMVALVLLAVAAVAVLMFLRYWRP